jgi:membrane fusion protein, multidrug efflux system
MLTALRMGERAEQRLRLESQVRAARARMENARADLDRATRLFRTNTITRAEFERSETSHRVAVEEHKSAVQAMEKGLIAREEDIDAQEGAVRGLEGRVVEASIQLADCTLLAPYDGVIAQRFVEVNENVQAQQRVVQFQDVDEIDIAVDVPESVMAADILSAEIVQMSAEFAAAPGRQYPVQIREVSKQADPITQTFRVRVAMQAPPDIRVLPGMTATVTVTYRRASILGNRILAPVSAIHLDSTGEQVTWEIGQDEIVERRPVKLGAATGGQVEIVYGLQPGDRIAVRSWSCTWWAGCSWSGSRSAP